MGYPNGFYDGYCPECGINGCIPISKSISEIWFECVFCGDRYIWSISPLNIRHPDFKGPRWIKWSLESETSWNSPRYQIKGVVYRKRDLVGNFWPWDYFKFPLAPIINEIE